MEFEEAENQAKDHFPNSSKTKYEQDGRIVAAKIGVNVDRSHGRGAVGQWRWKQLPPIWLLLRSGFIGIDWFRSMTPHYGVPT